MVGIGINEHTVLSKDTKINEKDTLELVLKQGVMTEEEKVMMSLQGKDADEKQTKLLLFSPKLTNDSTGVVKAQGQIMKEIQDYRKTLAEFLLCYLTTDEVEEKFGSTILKSLTGIEDDKAFVNSLKMDSTINKITLGINKLFISICNENNIFESTRDFRIKLWRQKKEKNYPKLPAGFSKWIEPMDFIPAKVTIEPFDMKPYDASSTICRISTEPLAADVVPEETVDVTKSMFSETTEEAPFVFDKEINID